jgi:hypothetical protein
VLPCPGACSAAPFPMYAALPRSEDSGSVRLPTARHESLAVRTLVSALPVQLVGGIGSRRIAPVPEGSFVGVLWVCTPEEPASTHPVPLMPVLSARLGDTVGLFDHARFRGDDLPFARVLRPADSLSTLHPRGYPRWGQDSVLTRGLRVRKGAFPFHWIPPCLLGATPKFPDV